MEEVSKRRTVQIKKFRRHIKTCESALETCAASEARDKAKHIGMARMAYEELKTVYENLQVIQED